MKIHETIHSNPSDFSDPASLVVRDAGFLFQNKLDGSKMRVLVIFLSCYSSRVLTVTDSVLFGIIKEKFGQDVFVDFSYYPDESDKRAYKRHEIPYFFGIISGKRVKEFDLVLVSNSVVDEQVNLINGLIKSGIEPYSSKRDRSFPSIILGGNSSSISKLLGEIVDGTCLGEAEVILETIIKIGLNSKEKNKQLEALEKFEWFYSKNSEAKQVKFSSVNSADDYKYYPDHSIASLHERDTKNIRLSYGCAQNGSCSFCLESNVCGSWSEKSYELVKQEIAQCKKQLPNSIGFLSFNMPKHSKIDMVLEESSKLFSKINTIGFRADSALSKPGFLEDVNTLGLMRCSVGVEGISERIRNDMLNKQISNEELLEFFTKCFGLRIRAAKMYVLFTGYENDEDKDEFLSFLKDINAAKRRTGAKTHISITISQLIHFPFTPISHMDRLSSKLAMQNCLYFSDIAGKVKDLGFGIRYTHKGHHSTLVQLICNYGEEITDSIVSMCKSDEFDVYKNYNDEKALKIISELLSKRPSAFDMGNTEFPKFYKVKSKPKYDYKTNVAVNHSILESGLHKMVACIKVNSGYGYINKSIALRNCMTGLVSRGDISENSILKFTSGSDDYTTKSGLIDHSTGLYFEEVLVRNEPIVKSWSDIEGVYCNTLSIHHWPRNKSVDPLGMFFVYRASISGDYDPNLLVKVINEGKARFPKKIEIVGQNLKFDSEVAQCKFKFTNHDKILIALPIKYNLYVFLMPALKKQVRKMYKILRAEKISCISIGGIVCKCGRGSGVIDVVTGKPQGKCLECYLQGL